jgi:hypothetical protein
VNKNQLIEADKSALIETFERAVRKLEFFIESQEADVKMPYF